jgi:hypothetical protein
VQAETDGLSVEESVVVIPVGHKVQDIAPADEYVPEGHAVHSDAPSDEYLPAGHAKQVDEEVAAIDVE